MTGSYESLVLKGTRHGLLASIREDAEWSLLLCELRSLSSGGEGFLTDASLTFDFGWRELTENQFDQVISALHDQGLTCNGILSTSLNTRTIAEERGYRAIIGRLGLAKHQGRRMRREKDGVAELKVADVPETVIASSKVESPEPIPTPQLTPPVLEDSFEVPSDHSIEEVQEESSQEAPRIEDEEPTLYLRKTLRSGQKVVFAGNVVLLGDLNPGAQIEADGDVIVMGQLRGAVHAGAEGDRTSTVIASSLQATQLRIADRFLSVDKKSSFFKKSTQTGTLRARLNGDSVVVEALR
ncbi:MAG: septum site-determining protein MinC [Vulcanimicrobiota bacterium]